MTKSLLLLILLLQPLFSNATHQSSVPKDVYNELEENSVPKQKALVDYGSSDIEIHKNSEEKSFGETDQVRHLQTLFEIFRNFLAAAFSFLLSIINPNTPVSIPTNSSLSNLTISVPTAIPTASPTASPTKIPTDFPTFSPSANPTTTPTDFPTFSLSASPSNIACEENDARIVGGKNAQMGRYPYQVYLTSSGCGGTLIAPDYVLSAAHCSGVNIVVIGLYDIANDDDYESISVDSEILHPEYDNSTYDNDFMLLKLANSSNYDPVTLDDGSAILNGGRNVTPIGWGRICFQGIFPNILQEVELDIVNNTECQSAYDIYDFPITENMVCASRSNKGVCSGDSGGPLLILGENAEDDIQVGITSWGIECARDEFPGVFSRVSTAYDWIMATIGSNP